MRRKQLGKKGQELRDMNEKALHQLSSVKKAFKDGREEADRYRASLVKRRGEHLRLRSYVVVAVGLERLLFEERTPGHVPAGALEAE